MPIGQAMTDQLVGIRLKISDFRERDKRDGKDGREISGGGVRGDHQSADDFADGVCKIGACGSSSGKHLAHDVGNLLIPLR